MAEFDKQLHLTEDDKKRYQIEIDEIDLDIKKRLLNDAPEKITGLLKKPDLTEFQVSLLKDITILYTILKTLPNLDENMQRKIMFALKYFEDSDDEIPDDIPGIGLLDDAIVVHWIVEEIKQDYSQYFMA
ncbi:MAG: YkvA family protein [Candidatus Neomarinimicrobiota bacterium]